MGFFKWIDKVFGSEPDQPDGPPIEERDVRWIEIDPEGKIFYLRINNEDSPKDYLFEDINDATYLDGVLTLAFDDSELELLSDDSCFHHLVKLIPRGLKSFDYERFDQFYINLQGCQICGLMARNGTKCMACEYDESEYVKHEGLDKEQQLNHFAMWFPITGKLENHSFGGFPLDPNWKLLVSKEEYEAWINPEPETL